MLYKLQKQDITKASAVLADAFQRDPLWLKFFEDQPDINRKFRTFFETPVRYCFRFGEVCATTENLEGVAAWVRGDLSYMTFWNMIRSGSFFSGMKLGADAGKKMGTVFKPMEEDRKQNTKDKSFIYLFVIGVATEFQGQGFGGKLLSALMDKCNESGDYLYLETETEQNAKWYEKFGFRTIKQITLPIVDHPMWEMVKEPEG